MTLLAIPCIHNNKNIGKRDKQKLYKRKKSFEQYTEIAKRDFERRVYAECDAEDKLADVKKEMFGDEAEYLNDNLGDK